MQAQCQLASRVVIVIIIIIIISSSSRSNVGYIN